MCWYVYLYAASVDVSDDVGKSAKASVMLRTAATEFASVRPASDKLPHNDWMIQSLYHYFHSVRDRLLTDSNRLSQNFLVCICCEIL